MSQIMKLVLTLKLFALLTPMDTGLDTLIPLPYVCAIPELEIFKRT